MGSTTLGGLNERVEGIELQPEVVAEIRKLEASVEQLRSTQVSDAERMTMLADSAASMQRVLVEAQEALKAVEEIAVDAASSTYGGAKDAFDAIATTARRAGVRALAQFCTTAESAPRESSEPRLAQSSYDNFDDATTSV